MELVFRELDQRFPEKVAADGMGEATEEAIDLRILEKKTGTTEAFTGRARWIFKRLQKGVDLPEVAPQS